MTLILQLILDSYSLSLSPSLCKPFDHMVSQPYDERLRVFAKAGLTLASGIPFDIQGFCGIVIFLGNPHADDGRLRHPNNIRLLQFAAQFIGSAAALQAPMKDAREMKNRQPFDNWKRLRLKVSAIVRFQRPLREKRRVRSGSLGSSGIQRVGSFSIGITRVGSFALSINREQSFKMLCEATTRLRDDIKTSFVDTQYAAKAKVMRWWRKVQGGNASIPPTFNFIQCMWTFFGVMVTHAILSRLNHFIVKKTAGELTFVVAPLGALTTLQYNLTAAPASQPRNAVFSQMLALSTAYFLHQMNLEPWLRCTLAPAIVVTGMAR